MLCSDQMNYNYCLTFEIVLYNWLFVVHWLGMTAMVVWKQQAWWHQWSGSWFSMVVWMHPLLLTLWLSFSRVSKFMDSMTLTRVVCCCLVPSCMSYCGLSTLKYLRSVTCSILTQSNVHFFYNVWLLEQAKLTFLNSRTIESYYVCKL